MCLLVRAASRPRPALRAGDRLLARAVSLACLEAAEACGYVAAVDAGLEQQLRRVVGTLVKLVAA